ncbi:MAG: penicillin-binding protein 1C, partial [Bernardetiaceae bacterium]|nr:penicillin-binding protein 1C [Bernardetiaceae bacterium]
ISSRILYSYYITLLHAFLSEDEKCILKSELQEISPRLSQTIIQKEDRYFYYHFGINPASIFRALFNNITKQKRTSGASTITMQVVRLLMPKARTYNNKIIEMFRATQLEWQYSKAEILQMYLNLVPYGGNIEGVKTASMLYFGQPPQKLSLAQIMTLAIVPNRPGSLSLQKGGVTITEARNKWLKRFAQAKVFDNESIEDALAEPLELNYQPLPRQAPHISIRWHQTVPKDSTYVYSTIDSHIQEKVRSISYAYIEKLKSYNINNAAVLVLDNRSMEVKAYLGSSDFHDALFNGQVDGVRAFRSPGSTLKPLIYGLAFDKGMLTPKVRIADVPVNFDGYAPENFDRSYQGLVSVKQALAYSLNVPAVKTLEQLGVDVMMRNLIAMNFTKIEGRDLGLSLALGGCGVSLEEMTGLYAMLARQGEWQPLRYFKYQKENNKIQILSPQTAYMISEILSNVERPELPSDYRYSQRIPKIAWKTGTSYGRRDAWSIGYNRHYTIAVWVGNFSNEGVDFLTGASAATPLLFKLFTNIDYDAQDEHLKKPIDLAEREVCALSGKVIADFCNDRITDYYIPTISRSDACQHLKYVLVSLDSTESYCQACLPAHYIKKRYPNLTSEITAYYDAFGIAYLKIPPHNPKCTEIYQDKESLRIISPKNQMDYYLDNATTQISLQAQAAVDVSYIYWYINDEFYQKTKKNQRIFFQPQEGKLKISCSDDKGRHTSIEVRILIDN